jgi:hypothetical protein
MDNNSDRDEAKLKDFIMILRKYARGYVEDEGRDAYHVLKKWNVSI